MNSEELFAMAARQPTELEHAVAGAIKDSMPGLINSEAWPWLALSRAAIRAVRAYDFSKTSK